MHSYRFVTLGVAMVCGLGVSKQSPTARPSLSGEWKRVADDAITDTASEARINKVFDSFCGAFCTIRDEGTVIRIVRDEYEGKPIVTFDFAKPESKNKLLLQGQEVSITTITKTNGDRVELSSQVLQGDTVGYQTISVALRNEQLQVERQLRGRTGVRKQLYSRRGKTL